MSPYTEQWWYKFITFSAITKRVDAFLTLLRDIINKQDPHSSHEIINLTWGLGGFFLYFLDHFAYHRVFTTADLTFLSVMSGITAYAAVTSSNNAKPPVTPTPPVTPPTPAPPAPPTPVKTTTITVTGAKNPNAPAAPEDEATDLIP